MPQRDISPPWKEHNAEMESGYLPPEMHGSSVVESQPTELDSRYYNRISPQLPSGERPGFGRAHNVI